MINEPTMAKINGKHDIAKQEIKDEVECVAGLRGWWDDHEVYGRRMVLSVPIRGRACAVYLYPLHDPMEDAWLLSSIYFVD